MRENRPISSAVFTSVLHLFTHKANAVSKLEKGQQDVNKEKKKIESLFPRIRGRFSGEIHETFGPEKELVCTEVVEKT